jgi:phage terminase large subunit
MGRINKVYKPLYTSKKRYFLVTGGRGSLKSTTVHDFICRLTYQQGQGILFTRYTMTSATKSIIPEFIETLKRNNSEKNFHVTKDKIINLSTGSFIIFSGIKTSSGNQTANLKSLSGITTWVVEEGEDFDDEKAFDTIDDSIRSNLMQNRVIWIQNPSTKEHFIYKRWIENTSKQIDVEGHKVTVSANEDVEHIHTTYKIALEFLSKSFVAKAENAKLNKPKWYYHNYIGGWLEKPEGVIFENWEEGDFDESLPFVWGMDFGYVNDPTTLIKVAKDKNNIYVKEFCYEKGLSTAQIDELLKETIHIDHDVIADNAEPRLIAELQEKRHRVFPCIKGKDSILNGITQMQDYNIIVDKASNNIKKELNNYRWNERINKPVDNYNHAIDAIRYAFDELTRNTEVIFI